MRGLWPLGKPCLGPAHTCSLDLMSRASGRCRVRWSFHKTLQLRGGSQEAAGAKLSGEGSHSAGCRSRQEPATTRTPGSEEEVLPRFLAGPLWHFLHLYTLLCPFGLQTQPAPCLSACNAFILPLFLIGPPDSL